VMSVSYHKVAEITFGSETAKFKIRSESNSADIQDAIRSRFDIPSEKRFVLIDKREGVDVVVDGTLETGAYTLEVPGDSKGCCPPGSLPASIPPTDYKVKGQMEDWKGVKVYVSGNKESKTGKAIFIFSDVFGSDSGRIRQIADEWALAGYFTVIPEFFENDPCPYAEGADPNVVKAWQERHSWNQAGPIAMTVYEQLKALGFSKFGAVGFCYGAFGVLKFSTGLVSAGVIFHPSHPRTCERFSLSEADLVEAVKCPQLLCPAGNDGPTLKKGGLNDQILSKKKF